MYPPTTITTVFNSYNESNGVAFNWVKQNRREADKGKMQGTTDWKNQIDRQIHRLKIYLRLHFSQKRSVVVFLREFSLTT